MVTSPLLGCLHKSFIYCLALQTPSATYTVAGNTDTKEIRLCSLDTPKQLAWYIQGKMVASVLHCKVTAVQKKPKI